METYLRNVRIILLGAPASGKSTVAREILKTQKGCCYLNLDDAVTTLMSEQGKLEVTDELINEATINILNDSVGVKNVLVELPHHDYMLLISENILDLESFDRVILLVADISQLIYRNAMRTKAIPLKYIHRCFLSQSMFEVEIFNSCFQSKCLVLKTDVLSKEEIFAKVLHFISLDA